MSPFRTRGSSCGGARRSRRQGPAITRTILRCAPRHNRNTDCVALLGPVDRFEVRTANAGNGWAARVDLALCGRVASRVQRRQRLALQVRVERVAVVRLRDCELGFTA